MRGYSTHDVAELVGLSEAKVRALARAGLLSPERRSRGAYRFFFQDIVLLRTAKELMAARIHPRKVWRALRSLKRRLPRGQSLAALRISAAGDQVIVREKNTLWQPESGQVTFDFSISDLAKQVAPLVRQAAKSAEEVRDASSDDWYNLAMDCETVSALEEAKQAYSRAIALNPTHAGAHINLGRLLHADGRVADAERHYRQALAAAPDNATGQFNLGVALEDLNKRAEAIKAYKQAIALDPELADAHYNLAHLYELRGEKSSAIRHLARYKALTSTSFPSPRPPPTRGGGE
jgi:tetratricopeptide (TPR) repeat protein